LLAALELANDRGIEAVTMRNLGQALGFEAMSLYHYVAGKDDVLDGILDLVLAESEPPSPSGEWDAAIRTSAISVHQALLRHPWACALMMSDARMRPARLRYMDALLGRLREAAFSAEMTYHAYHVLDAHIFGFATWQASHSYTAAEESEMAARLAELVPPGEYSYLHEHAKQHLTEGPQHAASPFEIGLDFILDGLRKIRDAR
jgi:AcrR family transcriptional regulator